jgi:hypothetical protein
VTEICRDNIQVCEDLPKETFSKVADLIRNESHLPRFLHVFDACLWVNKSAFPQTKYQLIQFLANPPIRDSVLGPFLSFFSITKSKPGVVPIEDKIKAFSSDDQFANPLECFRKWKTAGDAEVVYLITAIDFFTHLSHGCDIIAHGFLQTMVSAKSIALCFMHIHHVMGDSKNERAQVGSRLVFWELKRSLLALLEAGFLDSSMKDEEYAFSSLHTMLCRQAMSDVMHCCTRVGREGVLDLTAPICEVSAMGRYISGGVVKMLSSFFEHAFREDLAGPHLQETISTTATILKEAAVQVEKQTHLHNQIKNCLEIMSRASIGNMSQHAGVASYSSMSLVAAGGNGREEIDHERLNLEQSLSSLDKETVLCALEAARRKFQQNESNEINEQLEIFANTLQTDALVCKRMKWEHLQMWQSFLQVNHRFWMNIKRCPGPIVLATTFHANECSVVSLIGVRGIRRRMS